MTESEKAETTQVYQMNAWNSTLFSEDERVQWSTRLKIIVVSGKGTYEFTTVWKEARKAAEKFLIEKHSFSFGKVQDQKFIESVKQFPCLWDTRLTTYKCNETRGAAWEIIIKDNGIKDVQTAKAKWKKMRDNHRDAIKRQNSTRSGQAAKQITKWKYQKIMEFLLPFMQNRKRTSNFRDDSESYDDDTQMSATLNTTLNTAGDQMSNDSELIQLEDLLSNDHTQSTQSSGFSSKSKNRKLGDGSELLSQFQSNNEQRTKERAELKEILTASDDFDHFFLAILQLKVKRTAMTALMEAEEINEENSWTNQYGPPHRAPYGYSTAAHTETVTSQTHENTQSSSLNITEHL
ncbi:uncharacterized protein LOC125490065 [Plutella xylostella]|uniref:uncharacterized protein LOC125490065 n=1 Tax=Plutella xylostella TaxID=51655 RepID=UPI002032CF10|nr:uncharacterized protein LOC125490065 [Plutella xylostella]